MLALNVPLVLASRSPRRREMLRRLGVVFEVRVSDVSEEVDPSAQPDDAVREVALRKAEAVSAVAPEALVLGADTVVVLEGLVLGKPRDPAHAREMLALLSGRTHTVYTGIALLHPPSERTKTAVEATSVSFGELTPAEIERYVASGSPMDKAGAYGIQDDYGALLIDRIDGDYYNVVGLPLRRLHLTLRDHFADLLG